MAIHNATCGGAPEDTRLFGKWNRPTVITLVHGTFARGTPWTQPGSILRRKLADEMRERCGEVNFDVFEWSGKNTHKARIRAGYELADHVKRLREEHGRCRHFIVAHSHGGNIALLAHKHLRSYDHAVGVATLGTPFIRAEPDEAIEGKSLEQLLDEAPRHTDDVAAFTFWFLVFPTVVFLYFWLGESLEYPWYVWVLAFFLTTGLWGGFVRWTWPPLARFTHRFGARRMAAKLSDALELSGMPRTHLISFVYPGDEAGRLLKTLVAVTSWPTHLVNRAYTQGYVSWFIVLAPLAAVIATALGNTNVVNYDNVEEAAIEVLSLALLWVLLLTGILKASQYVLNLLRGHPWGFGWERPALHKFVSIFTESTANARLVKSYNHRVVPFTPTEDMKRGLRHSGFYEDEAILTELADWMADVR